MKRVITGKQRSFSRRMFLTLIGIVPFVILGLLTLHLHGANAVSHQVTAAAVASDMVPEDSVAPGTLQADIEHKDEANGAPHLDALTACVLALLLALALALPLSKRLHKSLQRALSQGNAHSAGRVRAPLRPLFLLLSISRT